MFVCDGCKDLQKKLDEQKVLLDRIRGMFQMLICECDHKQHGHDEMVGYCERCDCQAFKERS